MNLFQLISYSLFLVGVFEVLLGVILLRYNRRKSPVQSAVTALSLFSAAFSLTTSIMYARASAGLPIDIFARLNWIGWFTLPSAFLIVEFLKDEQSRRGRLIGRVLFSLWTIILGLCLFTDLIVGPGYSVIPFVNNPGPFEKPARFFGSLLALWLLYGLLRLKRELSGIKKAQLDYFLTGTVIFGGGASVTAGFMQLFGGFGFEPGLASFFSLPWVALTYYAISRHRLFDIRLVISRTLFFISLLLLFAGVQIGLYQLLKPELSGTASILISLTATGALLLGTRVSRRLQDGIQRLVLQDKYDYQTVLRECIKAIVTILDLDELLDYIVASMKKTLGVENVCFSLRENDSALPLLKGRGFRIERLITCPLNDTVAGWLQRTGSLVVREELERTLADADAAGVMVHAYLKEMGAEVVIPLLYKGVLKGWIVLGPKGSRQPYLQSDIDLLESLAGHAAVAIENARLYEETVRLYEERIDEEKRHQREKEKLLMDLHDGIGGITTNISILSELARKAGDVESIKQTLSTISQLSREGSSEIRSFMQGLDTSELSWRTLAAELRNRGANMLEPHGIAFMLEALVDDVPEQPGSLLWVNLLKIYKEALTNVIKHSKAASVQVLLKIAPDRGTLSVRDDGIGWDARRNSGRGLSNMKKRAEELGGGLTLSSGSGTRIDLEIPLPLKYPASGMDS